MGDNKWSMETVTKNAFEVDTEAGICKRQTVKIPYQERVEKDTDGEIEKSSTGHFRSIRLRRSPDRFRKQ